MSNTLQQIKTARVTAMKSGDKSVRDAVTLILAAITQAEVDTRSEITEEGVIQILTKMVKQRQESISMYDSAGRVELADIERSEVAIINQFLPAQVSDEEADALVRKTIIETGAAGIKDMGKVIGKLRPALVGRYDMGKVSVMVKTILMEGA